MAQFYIPQLTQVPVRFAVAGEYYPRPQLKTHAV